MDFKKSKLTHLALGVLLAISAGLVSIQSAEASFYGRGEHEELGRHHGGCDGGGGGGGSDNCITTDYSSSYYAYAQNQNLPMDGDTSGQRTVDIAYPNDIGGLLDSARLYVLAKDDATTDSTRYGGDGQEYLDILRVEGQRVSVNAVEVDNNGKWLFGFDVKQFVTPNDSPLSFLLATLNLCIGQSDLIFENARLDLKYHTVDCPPPPSPVPLPAAAWLFGSALFGFVTLSNRRKV